MVPLVLVFTPSCGGSGRAVERPLGFGESGKVYTDFGGNDVAAALAIQRDGKIIAAGGTDTSFAIARYTRDGGLDDSFGTDGTVVTEFGHAPAHESPTDYPHGAAAIGIQPDGRIVAAGGKGSDFALARYLPNGRLDRTFGQGGKVVTDVGARPKRLVLSSQSGADALAIQADGKIIAAGAGPDDFALVRYTADGRLDPSFGSGGMVFTSFAPPYPHAAAQAVAVQADRKIIAAGRGGSSFALARYLPNGPLDPSFGSGGKVVTDAGSDDFDSAYALALQPDGKIIASGSTCCHAGESGVLVRYTPSGSLDRSFGKSGIAEEFGGGKGVLQRDSGAILQRDGRLARARALRTEKYVPSYSYVYEVVLIRYTPAGRLDRTFGNGGEAVTRFRGIRGDLLLSAAAIQANGKIVVVGGAARANGIRSHDFFLARYRPTGRLDS